MTRSYEWREAMEMNMRALGVQMEETRRELEEAERRRAAEVRKMRGQVEERERELAAVKGVLGSNESGVGKGEGGEEEGGAEVELATCHGGIGSLQGMKIQDMKMNVELEIGQSEGDRKKALENAQIIRSQPEPEPRRVGGSGDGRVWVPTLSDSQANPAAAHGWAGSQVAQRAFMGRREGGWEKCPWVLGMEYELGDSAEAAWMEYELGHSAEAAWMEYELGHSAEAAWMEEYELGHSAEAAWMEYELGHSAEAAWMEYELGHSAEAAWMEYELGHSAEAAWMEYELGHSAEAAWMEYELGHSAEAAWMEYELGHSAEAAWMEYELGHSAEAAWMEFELGGDEQAAAVAGRGTFHPPPYHHLSSPLCHHLSFPPAITSLPLLASPPFPPAITSLPPSASPPIPSCQHLSLPLCHHFSFPPCITLCDLGIAKSTLLIPVMRSPTDPCSIQPGGMVDHELVEAVGGEGGVDAADLHCSVTCLAPIAHPWVAAELPHLSTPPTPPTLCHHTRSPPIPSIAPLFFPNPLSIHFLSVISPPPPLPPHSPLPPTLPPPPPIRPSLPLPHFSSLLLPLSNSPLHDLDNFFIIYRSFPSPSYTPPDPPESSTPTAAAAVAREASERPSSAAHHHPRICSATKQAPAPFPLHPSVSTLPPSHITYTTPA
ncbi:unnamed protein product [Closterium sp. Naga37s-1]|nr:unnamed protein product [Closterium sp. Naga37s-1]